MGPAGSANQWTRVAEDVAEEVALPDGGWEDGRVANLSTSAGSAELKACPEY